MTQGRIIYLQRFLSIAFIATLLSVASARANGADAPAVPGEYIVRFKGAFASSKPKGFSSLGSWHVSNIINDNLIKLNTNPLLRRDHVLSVLRADANVVVAEPNYIYSVVRTPNDPKLAELWGLINTGKKSGRMGVDVGVEAAWDITTGSENVVVAVIDTGLDYTHEDLAQNAWVNHIEANGQPNIDDDGNGFVDDIYGYDFVNNDGDPMDDHGHGTHCSGTIGARGDDGKGIVGVAWNVKIMGLKFLAANGSGTLEGAVRAIQYATEKGVDIMSNSWGGGGFSQILHDAIAAAQQKGILFIAAAGNDSNDNDARPSYPASYQLDNVISVAAIDRKGQLATFSNYGKNSVHVAAPGVEVLSSIPGGYAAWNGTSMATPHVSGVAALLKAAQPFMSYQEIKTRILQASRPLGTLRGKLITGGVVNAYYALTGQEPPQDPEDPYYWTSREEIFSTPHPYLAGTTVRHVVQVPGAKRISVYFERFETESGFDKVTFKDANGNLIESWSGKQSERFSPVANGDTIIIELKSDQTVTKYGFDITKTAYQ